MIYKLTQQHLITDLPFFHFFKYLKAAANRKEVRDNNIFCNILIFIYIYIYVLFSKF